MSLSSTMPAPRGVVYVAVAATAWGTGGAIAARLYHEAGLGPVAVSWWRFAIGALVLAVGRSLWRARSARPPVGGEQTGPGRIRLAMIGAGLAAYHTAYLAAVGMAGVAIATVITLGAGPLLIAVGARLFLTERLSAADVAILVVALGGLSLLVLDGGLAGG
ncbi:MAG TPA: EamA family transporter, partial [Micromonosporaceae bacterium]